MEDEILGNRLKTGKVCIKCGEQLGAKGCQEEEKKKTEKEGKKRLVAKKYRGKSLLIK